MAIVSTITIEDHFDGAGNPPITDKTAYTDINHLYSGALVAASEDLRIQMARSSGIRIQSGDRERTLSAARIREIIDGKSVSGAVEALTEEIAAALSAAGVGTVTNGKNASSAQADTFKGFARAIAGQAVLLDSEDRSNGFESPALAA